MKKNKSQLVKSVAEKGDYYEYQISKAVDDVLVKGRNIKDVNTGQIRYTNPYYKVHFAPSSDLKEAIKNQDTERYFF